MQRCSLSECIDDTQNGESTARSSFLYNCSWNILGSNCNLNNNFKVYARVTFAGSKPVNCSHSHNPTNWTLILLKVCTSPCVSYKSLAYKCYMDTSRNKSRIYSPSIHNIEHHIHQLNGQMMHTCWFQVWKVYQGFHLQLWHTQQQYQPEMGKQFHKCKL